MTQSTAFSAFKCIGVFSFHKLLYLPNTGKLVVLISDWLLLFFQIAQLLNSCKSAILDYRFLRSHLVESTSCLLTLIVGWVDIFPLTVWVLCAAPEFQPTHQPDVAGWVTCTRRPPSQTKGYATWRAIALSLERLRFHKLSLAPSLTLRTPILDSPKSWSQPRS